jgi:hypothetical protein
LDFDGDISIEGTWDDLPTVYSISIWFYRKGGFEASDQVLVKRNSRLDAYFSEDNFDTLILSINGDTEREIDLSNQYNSWLNHVVIHTSSSAYEFGVFTVDGDEITNDSDHDI